MCSQKLLGYMSSIVDGPLANTSHSLPSNAVVSEKPLKALKLYVIINSVSLR